MLTTLTPPQKRQGIEALWNIDTGGKVETIIIIEKRRGGERRGAKRGGKEKRGEEWRGGGDMAVV